MVHFWLIKVTRNSVDTNIPLIRYSRWYLYPRHAYHITTITISLGISLDARAQKSCPYRFCHPIRSLFISRAQQRPPNSSCISQLSEIAILSYVTLPQSFVEQDGIKCINYNICWNMTLQAARVYSHDAHNLHKTSVHNDLLNTLSCFPLLKINRSY